LGQDEKPEETHAFGMKIILSFKKEKSLKNLPKVF
jgi:hypothetical protein